MKTIQVGLLEGTLTKVERMRRLFVTESRGNILAMAVDIADKVIHCVSLGGKVYLEYPDGERQSLDIPEGWLPTIQAFIERYR